VILDYYAVAGAGPAGGSDKRLELFLERWRACSRAGKVVVLVAHDHSHVVVVSAPKALA